MAPNLNTFCNSAAFECPCYQINFLSGKWVQETLTLFRTYALCHSEFLLYDRDFLQMYSFYKYFLAARIFTFCSSTRHRIKNRLHSSIFVGLVNGIQWYSHGSFWVHVQCAFSLLHVAIKSFWLSPKSISVGTSHPEKTMMRNTHSSECSDLKSL